MTTKKQKKIWPESDPLAFYNFARSYHDAGSELLKLSPEVRPGQNRLYNEPILMMFAHSIESLLKAYLRSHNVAVGEKWKHHNWKALYDECLALGLKVTDKNYHLWNAVSLLTDANEEQGLRYFTFRSGGAPTLELAQEGSSMLLQSITADFNNRGLLPAKPGKIVKGTITFGFNK